MAEIRVTAEGEVGAPAEHAYRLLANYREHHHRFLPPAFTDYHVEQGGVGAGTVVTFKLRTGGRTQAGRAVVAEPEPGRVLEESDPRTGLVTTFTVTPAGEGCRVRIDTAWPPRGIPGFVERLFAPRILRSLYADELARLDRYAGETHLTPEGMDTRIAARQPLP